MRRGVKASGVADDFVRDGVERLEEGLDLAGVDLEGLEALGVEEVRASWRRRAWFAAMLARRCFSY